MRRKIDARNISLLDFVLQLPAVVREADERRLSCMLDQFKLEYPDFYYFAEGLVDREPAAAKLALIERWPALALLAIHPEADRVIAAIQTQIKARRKQP